MTITEVKIQIACCFVRAPCRTPRSVMTISGCLVNLDAFIAYKHWRHSVIRCSVGCLVTWDTCFVLPHNPGFRLQWQQLRNLQQVWKQIPSIRISDTEINIEVLSRNPNLDGASRLEASGSCPDYRKQERRSTTVPWCSLEFCWWRRDRKQRYLHWIRLTSNPKPFALILGHQVVATTMMRIT